MPLTEYKWDDWQQLSVGCDGCNALFTACNGGNSYYTIWHDKV